MYEYKATIHRVIDGDTAEMMVDLGFYTYVLLDLRFSGIDTPERGKPGFNEATNYVKEFFVLYPTVQFTSHGLDKYGRWLAEIIDPRGGTLNKALVDNNLAKVYLP